MDAVRNARWGGVVPKPGQTLPLLPSAEETQGQINAITKAILWSMVPESFKPDSEETTAEWNRRMTWYMQHPEYVAG